MLAASSRGRRIPAALHVFVIAMLALTLIGPLVTPLAVDAAQTPIATEEPVVASSESEPSTGEQPPPPSADPVETAGEPTTAPVVEQPEEVIEESPTDPTTEPGEGEDTEEPPTLPATEPAAGEGAQDPVTEPDETEPTDSPELPVTDPAGETVVGPGTPTTEDIDPGTDALESAAEDDPAAAATMRFTNVRTIGPSDCTPESTAFIDLTVENADPTFLGVHIFLLATSTLTNETTILGNTTVDASLGSGKYFQPITGDFSPNFRNFRVELYLFDGESQERQAQIVPIVTGCEGNQPVPPPMRFTNVLVSGPETCTRTSNVSVLLTVNDADPTFLGVRMQLVETSAETGLPLSVGRNVTIDASRGNGRFGESVEGDFSSAFSDWEIRISLLDGEGNTQQSQTFPVQPNCTPVGEPTDPPAPSMRFTNVRTIMSEACNPGSVAFVDLTVENADPTFRGVEIGLLSNNTLTNTVVIHDNTIVEASRGSGKYFQPVTGDFSSAFQDFRVELRLVDGEGKNRQVQIVPVELGCGAEQPLPPPMRFTQVAIFGPDTCTATSDIQVDLTVNDVDPTFQGVEIRLLATSTETNQPVVLGNTATIDPSRGNGRFGSIIRGNFTAEFTDWRVEILLLNGEGATHQQQTFTVKTTCTPPEAPPPPPMQFSQVRAFAPGACDPASTVFVELTVQNAGPTFRGVLLSLQATNTQTNNVEVLGSVVVDASRGSGKFIQPVPGDLSAGFTDFHVELALLDNAGTTHQTQTVQVQRGCEGNQPLPPPMRFTSVFVIGPDTCTATSDVRVVLTVNDADPAFQGVEMRLLATNTVTNKTVLFPGPTIKPSQGNGTFTEFIQANLTTEFSDWRVQVILFGESSIAQEQTFPVQMNCTPPSPEPPLPPMQFTDVVVTGPDTCTAASTVEVQLTVQNADSALIGVQIEIRAISTEDNRERFFVPKLVESARGDGTFTESLQGNFTARFRDWRVRLVIFDSDGNIHQEQDVPIETDCPNPPPTEEPTEIPTEEPTEEPTEVPTEEPTEEPVEEAPTENPTEEPTEEVPTEQPTEIPTEESTEVPTELPTEAPTETPTELPTEEPTEVPTEQPTEQPTEEPTQEVPTEQPTEIPTELPTEIATEVPTKEPTEIPTEAPIEEPTEAPTEAPTEEPIELPTEDVPTEEPTEIPTEEPTEEAPIDQPTEAPTEEPVEDAPVDEPTNDIPVEDVPVEQVPPTEDPGAIQPVDDVDNLPASPVAVPFQRLANEVVTPEPDDTLQIAALPVAGSGVAPGNHSTVLLAAVASSLVLAFLSATVRRGGVRRH